MTLNEFIAALVALRGTSEVPAAVLGDAPVIVDYPVGDTGFWLSPENLAIKSGPSGHPIVAINLRDAS